MTYSNKNVEIFNDQYKKYFNKQYGAKVVKTRGMKKISEYIQFHNSQRYTNVLHESNAFCINDKSSALDGIRLNESKFMILDEGLIMTYPTEKVLSHFKRLFLKYVSSDLADAVFPGTKSKIIEFHELSDNNENISPLLMVCVPAHDDEDAKHLVKQMTDEFAKTGYYMTSYDVNDTKNFKLVYIQFEAKYTDMLSELQPILYHVTPLKYLDKIMKNGLAPYSKAKNFNYSPRVYLFNKCPKEQVFSYGLFKSQEANDNGFCVFKIFKDKLMNDPLFKDGKQRFYLDPAFSMSDDLTDQTAIFTYGNIPLRIIERKYALASIENGEIIDVRTKSF